MDLWVIKEAKILICFFLSSSWKKQRALMLHNSAKAQQ